MGYAREDYDQAFEDACQALRSPGELYMVRGQMLRVEEVLWLALRRVFAGIAVAVASLVVLPPVYLLDLPQSLATGLLVTGSLSAVSVLVYWLCRLVFHLEISSRIRGRRFGEGLVEPDASGQ
jgi:hypothetical protein